MQPRRTFRNVRCPKCGEADALAVDVETLALVCTACASPIRRVDVNAMLAKWHALLAWLDGAPSSLGNALCQCSTSPAPAASEALPCP